MIETRATSRHLDRALQFLAEADEAMGPIARDNSVTYIEAGQCVWVAGPNGARVECRVIEKLPSLFSMFEQVGVEALHGRPFDGQAKVVVPKSRVFAHAAPAVNVPDDQS